MATTDPAEILRRVLALFEQAFTVPVGASLTVGPPVAPRQVATDSHLAQLADGVQVRAGEGPAQDAFERREGVVKLRVVAAALVDHGVQNAAAR